VACCRQVKEEQPRSWGARHSAFPLGSLAGNGWTLAVSHQCRQGPSRRPTCDLMTGPCRDPSSLVRGLVPCTELSPGSLRGGAFLEAPGPVSVRGRGDLAGGNLAGKGA
jgi:hypothetical protein